ncbi:MAG: M28 family peptidase [Planctomycetota bacterium]
MLNLTRDAVFLGQELGMRFTNGDKFCRSDHINFARKGIPIVFFCDDEHPDYHMTTDTPDKLEYDKLERIGRISFLVGCHVTQGVYVPDSLGSKEDWFSDRSDRPGPGRGPLDSESGSEGDHGATPRTRGAEAAPVGVLSLPSPDLDPCSARP